MKMLFESSAFLSLVEMAGQSSLSRSFSVHLTAEVYPPKPVSFCTQAKSLQPSLSFCLPCYQMYILLSLQF